MGNVNKVILIGRLGKDPEVINFDSGGKKVNFSLATSEVYYDKDQQKKEVTEWHNIVMWRGLAETAEKYLKKGDLLYVEGRIRTRSWEDKETQQKRYITEIQADSMNMLGSPKASQNGSEAPMVRISEVAEEGGDLPF